MKTTRESRIQWPEIVVGIVLCLVGTVALTGGAAHWTVVHPGKVWPLFLVGVGLAAFRDGGGGEELRKGLILLAVGLWLLVNTLGIGGLDYGDSWPLLLILIGLALTFTRGRGRRCCGGQGPILIFWGSLAWIAIQQHWGLTWSTIWPLVVVAIGLSIVWRAIADQLFRSTSGSRGEDDVD